MLVRKNLGGAYLLRDNLGEILQRAAPADQLKLVQREGDNAAFEAASYLIRDIYKHRTAKDGKYEYFVNWKDPGIEPGWEPVEHFDDIDVIPKYWKMVRPTRSTKIRK